MNSSLQGLLSWWQTLSDETRLRGLARRRPSSAWIVWCLIAYLSLRRLAGHRKFQGRWYNEAEYARLMQVLWEDQQAGSPGA